MADECKSCGYTPPERKPFDFISDEYKDECYKDLAVRHANLKQELADALEDNRLAEKEKNDLRGEIIRLENKRADLSAKLLKLQDTANTVQAVADNVKDVADNVQAIADTVLEKQVLAVDDSVLEKQVRVEDFRQVAIFVRTLLWDRFAPPNLATDHTMYEIIKRYPAEEK
jgi:hypothetical protein